MAIEAGSRIGSYEVRAQLGAGGMGEVYLARDTKLNRDVALKLLPQALAHDPDRLARFRREAQLLAALNHPQIAQIYGLDDSSSQPVLVMEFVPGRTLAEAIAAGPLSWEQAVPVARQIAEALEAAHEQGIVHRDLKPANIKVREDGVVKVLDFGLAKAMDAAGSGETQAGSSGLDGSPTITSPARWRGAGGPATSAGVILGTAAYMAPEQAKGRAVDKRADIWAFGVVFFEMLTGRPLFAGETVTETLASVLRDPPALERLPEDTPGELRRLIARCLERVPKQRLRDIGEARIVLWNAFDAPVPAARKDAPAWKRAGAGLGLAALGAAAGLGAWSLASAPGPTPSLRRFELPAAVADAADYAISPDGGRLAYIRNGQLFVRRLDALDATVVGPVHVTARQIFWSPDGAAVGFTAEGAIQSIPVAGGPPFVITRVPASGRVMGITWLPAGRIVFSVWRDSLYAVAATGGTPVVRLAIDPKAEIDFHDVAALPDGRLLIATHRRTEDSDVIELVDGERRTVLTADRNVGQFEYVDPGTLVFCRRTTNPGIWAVPFDGGPVDVNRATLVQAGAADYRVALDGTIVARIPTAVRHALVWVDRSGRETPAPGPLVESSERDLELSPDGRRVAFVQGRRGAAGPGIGSRPEARILVRDLETGVDTPLTIAAPGATMWADTGAPTWFPSGDRILHRTGGIESFELVERRADVAGDARVITRGTSGRILADGRTMVFTRDERGDARAYWASAAADGTLESRPLFERGNPPDVGDFDVSSDGGLLAYVAVQPTGRGDIYLSPLPRADSRGLVIEGGARPRFSRDGRQLFFLSGVTDEQGQPQGRLMSVAVRTAPTLALGVPAEILRDSSNGVRLSSYDVAPDGSRFLMWKAAPPSPGEQRRLVLVQNGLIRRDVPVVSGR